MLFETNFEMISSSYFGIYNYFPIESILHFYKEDLEQLCFHLTKINYDEESLYVDVNLPVRLYMQLNRRLIDDRCLSLMFGTERPENLLVEKDIQDVHILV